MARISKKEREEKLLRMIRKRAAKGIEAARENRERCVRQKEFVDNEHWSDADKAMRKGRPCLTINRVNPAIDQAIGDQRQNVPILKVRPVSSDATVELAQIREGKLRHLTNQISARQAVNVAAKSQLQGGMGFIRVITEYVADTGWEQQIKIVPVQNELSVIYDPAAQQWDRNDGQWMIVYGALGRDEYEEKYGRPASRVEDMEDDDRGATKNDEGQSFETEDEVFAWRTEDSVIIAEYFYKQYQTKTIYLLEDGTVTEIPYGGNATGMPDDPSLRYVLDANGKPKSREIKTYKIMCYKVDGARVLEGPYEWPSQSWGVIPVWGKNIIIKGKEKFKGIPWDAMDANLLYDYYVSAAAETYSKAPKSQVMLTPQMLSGHEVQWDNANSRNDMYLLINPVDESNPSSIVWPQQLSPPQVSPALITGQQQAAEDIRTTTGRHLASLGAQDNAVSGVALANRQREGDIGDMEYVDNLNIALAKIGEVVLELMPTIYDTTRLIRTLAEDMITTQAVEINQPADLAQLSAEKASQLSQRGYANDITQGKYEIHVDTGPSATTQRMEAANFYTQVVQTAPGLAAIMGDIMMRAQDVPESQTVANRLKAEMLKQGKGYLFAPEEIQELYKKLPLLAIPEQKPPDPLAMAMMKAEQMKALKMFMDAMKTEAQIGEIQDNQLLAIADRMNSIYQTFQKYEQQMSQGQQPQQPQTMQG